MTDVTMTAPLDEVRSLVDERGRYEGWLAALESRRAVTPAHVLERVRGDYEGRLRRVLGALEGHVGALRADEALLATHHDQQLQRLGERRDALAEVELRTLVGEFPPEEGERQRREVEGEIGGLEGSLSNAAAQLGELRGLLGRVVPDAALAAEPQGGGAMQPGSEDVRETPAAGASAVSAGPAEAGDPHGLDAARAALGDPDVHGYVPAHYAPSIRSGDAHPMPPLAGQRFAEAAFGVPVGGPGAQQPGAGGGITQEKTLRCPDCGALNYPTDWYCEKCGGELAAL